MKCLVLLTKYFGVLLLIGFQGNEIQHTNYDFFAKMFRFKKWNYKENIQKETAKQNILTLNLCCLIFQHK